MKLLRNATTAERNAAFNAVHPKIQQYIRDHAPGFFQNQLLQGLESPAGVAGVLDLVDAALEAAEAEREKVGSK